MGKGESDEYRRKGTANLGVGLRGPARCWGNSRCVGTHLQRSGSGLLLEQGIAKAPLSFGARS